MASISQARMDANHRYDAKAYKNMLLRLKPELDQRLRAYAEKSGESLNGFITDAITAALDAAEKQQNGG